MKKQTLLSLALLLLFIGCQQKETPKTEYPVVKNPTLEKECYAYEGDGNSIQLTLERNGFVANGTLTYALAEKDKNNGTIKGKITNNILLADYTFLSEGKESIRQVAFQYKDGKWIEGFGEMNEEGTKFKDVALIKFISTMPLTKTDCLN